MRVCGNCKAEIDDQGASFYHVKCTSCGWFVYGNGATSSKKECPTCGAKHPPEYERCPDCYEVFPV